MKTNLVKCTQEFFSMHWNITEAIPEWDFSWNYMGPVPNYLLGGVYALLKGDEVIYIGLGISRGSGIYKDRGLSRRLMAHVCHAAPKGYTTDVILLERWLSMGVDKVATIGFSEKRNYMAAALEDYLIGCLNPTANCVKKIK